MSRQPAKRKIALVLLGAVLGGIVGLALVEVVLSPAFASYFRSWGAEQLQQFLRQPVVSPFGGALIVGLGFYLGGRLALWLLWDRRNPRNEVA